LVVTDSAGGAPVQRLALSGNGVAPAITMGTGTYAFGNVSSATAATFILANTGTAPFEIGGITLATGVQFVVTGGTCAISVIVNSGNTCSVIVTFTPTSNLVVTDRLTVTGSGLGTGVPTYSAARAMSGR
jgi:hypothetical protein